MDEEKRKAVDAVPRLYEGDHPRGRGGKGKKTVSSQRKKKKKFKISDIGSLYMDDE
ncbi:hypothetical protein [Paucidesulfovibrio gracilis]|uniref:hypothetical protein n=1 Tax=Paucidesulfovibrio gracilis TaxID=47158 RepID=UPI0013566957|nr:hypothetical protein [Paucidesulfovibrio gracilis]